MKYLATLLLLALPAFAGVVTTDGPWTYGTTESYPTHDACVAAMALKVPRSTAYSCKTTTRVLVTASTPPPPVAVDCVVNDPPWVQGAVTPAICPTSGQQSRTDTRTLTVLTQPANGGMACPALNQSTTVTVACVPPVTPPPASADWDTRSKAPGVLQALSFRDSVMPKGCGGNFPSSGACYEKGASQSATASSAGVTLYTQGPGGANQSGDLFIKWPQTMGSGKRFWASYSVTLNGFADALGNTPDLGGQGWKVSDFFGQRPCGDTELTLVNFYYDGIYRAYVNCSNSRADNFELPASDGGYSMQQTDVSNTFCEYGGSTAKCLKWTNKPTYFLFDVTLGPSIVKVYQCQAGDGAWKQFISSTKQSIGGPGFSYTDFTNYDTSKGGSKPAPAVYTATYSEWLLSTQPIALPSACL